jgi:hypothetical protein
MAESMFRLTSSNKGTVMVCIKSGAKSFSEIRHMCTYLELIPAEKYLSFANRLLKK